MKSADDIGVRRSASNNSSYAQRSTGNVSHTYISKFSYL